MDTPSSLIRDISPPTISKRRKLSIARDCSKARKPVSPGIEPTLAAVGAEKAKVDDHVSYFKKHLSRFFRPSLDVSPRLSISQFVDLYTSNLHPHGQHFVIHQHNHPIAGLHYDLRLQFSKTSSLSFAIPNGMPGHPNSNSLGRIAIETRVHNLWNHLIESASFKTGSLLIWDTGTYGILPRKTAKSKISPSPQTTDQDSDSDYDLRTSFTNTRPLDSNLIPETHHENNKLISAFQSRYIRLQLHGTRLPETTPVTKRKQTTYSTTSDSDSDSNPIPEPLQQIEQNLDTDSETNTATRLHNAYPGSTNTINSIHQRRWFLTLDRPSSGFVQIRPGVWGRDGEAGFEPFFVRGREYERSIVTGRLAADVESDEGLEGFRGRGGWVGITT
ncbi:DNA polymerase ligase-domain-containing protein [Dendryphion nanum]|uniref:DNA polymerase ligase-domain-containing protein n=1 Tax=Dendryphion nanum TaxID=256645 RepID=A0A9P9ILG2_9PLEO|nr:DNA polymerase ligase-domain-containing protein [Dendryphion nanum]